MKSKDKDVILSLKNVEIAFGEGKKRFVAVHDASFDIYRGETFSLVGESGSGKTTIGRAINRINHTSGGEIIFNGEKINGQISSSKQKEVIKNIQMIFQDPSASLNERATVEYVVSEGLYNFNLFKNEEDRLQKVESILTDVGLLKEHLYRYPHEFSGGQRQRIGIARALIMEPQLVIADEPISALDVSVRAQVLNLMHKFQREQNLTYLFIAHDLSVVRFVSDRIAVIKNGRILEVAETEELFRNPLHPYTKSLLSAVPVPDPVLARDRKLIVYDPDQHDYSELKPSMREIIPEHFVYCNDPEFEAYQKAVIR